MLTDPAEIEIASRARQAGIRDPDREREPFERFFADFASSVSLSGAELLDLGPGQWDFGVLARERGAARVLGVDNDEAVVELGAYKGFDAVLGDIRHATREALGTFDGVYNRGSLNATWGATDEEHARLIDQLTALVRDDGWGWFAPWNGIPKRALTDEQIGSRLKAQVDAFARNGYAYYEPDGGLARTWTAGGAVLNNAIFVRNLDVPSALARL